MEGGAKRRKEEERGGVRRRKERKGESSREEERKGDERIKINSSLSHYKVMVMRPYKSKDKFIFNFVIILNP